MNIAIIVLNYRGLSDTLECVETLRKLEIGGNDIRIVVVDNNSSDGSAEALSKLKDIDLIQNSDNLGYAGGNNVGIRSVLKMETDAVLILNNDTVVDKSLIKNLVWASRDGDIVSPKIYFAPGFEFHKDRYKKSDQGRVIWYAGGRIDWGDIIGRHIGVDQVDRGQFAKRKSIEMATGACMFVKREVFEKIGFFNENYFLYLEDMDFCVRAKKAGFRIIFEPHAVLWHKNASSAGGSGSNLQDYYICRNRLLFAFKYASLKTKLLVLREILSQIKNPVKKAALVDFLTFRLGKGSIT